MHETSLSISFSFSCNLSLFPSHQVCLILLPQSRILDEIDFRIVDLAAIGSYSSASIIHSDMESQVPLRTLVPYSWSGEWPTSFRFASDSHNTSKPAPTKTPLKVLSFIHKKAKTRVSFVLLID